MPPDRFSHNSSALSFAFLFSSFVFPFFFFFFFSFSFLFFPRSGRVGNASWIADRNFRSRSARLGDASESTICLFYSQFANY